MKRLISVQFLTIMLFAAAILLFSTLAAAETVLTWDANTEPDLAGYKVYESKTPGDYLNPLETLGKVTEYTIPHDMTECFYWVLTAFDLEELESDVSNEVSNCDGLKPAAPGLIINIRDSIVTINTGN